MAKFALISEGITDQVVLETLISEHYERRHGQEPIINILQPLRDATDEARADGMGGWERVLEYCSLSERIEEASALNDYIVIQIDTDCGDHPNFGVALTHGGVDRPVDDIIKDTKALLISKIDPQVYAANSHKFIFAIAVHSLECWLIPLHASSGNRPKIKSCETHLRSALSIKQRIKYEKTYRSYQKISAGFGKLKNITLSMTYDRSLEVFVSSLP